ncbi:MAG: hypothetical protein ACREMY_13040 [bacterium]
MNTSRRIQRRRVAIGAVCASAAAVIFGASLIHRESHIDPASYYPLVGSPPAVVAGTADLSSFGTTFGTAGTWSYLAF